MVESPLKMPLVYPNFGNLNLPTFPLTIFSLSTGWKKKTGHKDQTETHDKVVE